MIDRQKLEDIAIILPCVGFFLILPPVLTVFDSNTLTFHMPSLPVYLFALWLTLIIAGYLITRKLVKAHEHTTKEKENTPPPTPPLARGK